MKTFHIKIFVQGKTEYHDTGETDRDQAEEFAQSWVRDCIADGDDRKAREVRYELVLR